MKHSKINELAKEDYKAVENLYWEIDKPQELLEKTKNGNLSEVAIELIEKGEQDASIHYEAIITSEKMNKKIAGDLREENRNQSELLQENDERLIKMEKEIQQLKKENLEYLRVLKESDEREVKKDQKIKLLETQLSSNDKPLSKNSSKLKALKEKAKTKIQHLVEKSKQRSQELIAKIEVKVK